MIPSLKAEYEKRLSHVPSCHAMHSFEDAIRKHSGTPAEVAMAHQLLSQSWASWEKEAALFRAWWGSEDRSGG